MHYGRDDGCEVCAPAKEHIRWPDPFESAGAEAEDLLTDNVRLLKRLHRRLERDVDNTPTKAFPPEEAKAAREISQAIVKASAELRQQERLQRTRMQNTSFKDRVKLMIEFWDSLPREWQDNFAGDVVARIRGREAPSDG